MEIDILTRNSLGLFPDHTSDTLQSSPVDLDKLGGAVVGHEAVSVNTKSVDVAEGPVIEAMHETWAPLAKALANLSLAFQHKDSVLKGEKKPDPRTDSSFQKYVRDDDFIVLMKKLGYQ